MMTADFCRHNSFLPSGPVGLCGEQLALHYLEGNSTQLKIRSKRSKSRLSVVASGQGDDRCASPGR